MNDRRKLIQFKREIQRYLHELDELCLQTPQKNELLSLEATEQIRRDSLESLRGKPVRRIHMGFDERKAARFRDYVARLHQANSKSVYVWTEKSNSCGLYEISSLLKFNFDFEHDVNEQGIVVLLASDLTDNLVLDFSPDDTLAKYELEIDVCGEHWTAIDY